MIARPLFKWYEGKALRDAAAKIIIIMAHWIHTPRHQAQERWTRRSARQIWRLPTFRGDKEWMITYTPRHSQCHAELIMGYHRLKHAWPSSLVRVDCMTSSGEEENQIVKF